MITSQKPSKIQAGLKFRDELDEIKSPKRPKYEKPGHKSYQFAKSM